MYEYTHTHTVSSEQVIFVNLYVRSSFCLLLANYATKNIMKYKLRNIKPLEAARVEYIPTVHVYTPLYILHEI